MSRQRELFSITGQTPEPLDPKKKAELIVKATKYLQIVERDSIGRDLVRVRVNVRGPVTVINGGDYHIAALPTDMDEIVEFVKDVRGNPRALLIVTGDVVEGITQKYLNTNAMRAVVDLDGQYLLAEEYLIKPLADRIVCSVGGYWGHEGWIEDATTDNPWKRIVGRYGIPVLRNGGRVEIVSPGGQVTSYQAHHNPPGRSKIEPIYGLRQAALLTDERRRPDVYYSAHIHEMGVAEENFPDAVRPVVMVSCGTPKGSNKNLPPDRFGVKLGLPLADPMNGGAGTILGSDLGPKRIYPYPTGRHGKVMGLSLELLDRVEQQGLTSELVEKINRKLGPPKLREVKETSVEAKDPFDEKPKGENGRRKVVYGRSSVTGEVLAPQYDQLTYNIETKLPVVVHPEANVRLGSSYSGREKLAGYLDRLVVDNPHAFVLYLRSLVDKETAGSGNRVDVLDDYIELMGRTPGRVLAFLLCEALRVGAWKREVFKEMAVNSETGKEYRVYDPPIAPGTYVAEQTGVPMVHHLSRIVLAVGPSGDPNRNLTTEVVVADKLENHGSVSKPAFGPKRLYDLHVSRKPEVITGGHMPGSGVATFYDGSKMDYAVEVMPGWWSPYVDTLGLGNVKAGARSGQGIVIVPGVAGSERLIFPTANEDETEYVHKALLLYAGLSLTGLRDKVVKRGR